jgi:hypothetical protein
MTGRFRLSEAAERVARLKRTIHTRKRAYFISHMSTK